MVQYTVGDSTYHLDDCLIKMWTRINLQKMVKKNSDRVYIIDGRERVGKSVFAIQQMGYLDKAAFSSPEEFIKRICFSPTEFNKACREIKNGVIVFDEAFRGLSSRSALSKINKIIVQTLQEMGQNNNIVFLVLPSFFLLDWYAAIQRSDGLFRITEDKKTSLRCFQAWNRDGKNKIYKFGAKGGWNYPVGSPLRGRFANKFAGGQLFLDAYLKKKSLAFQNMLTDKDFEDKVEKTPEKIEMDKQKEEVKTITAIRNDERREKVAEKLKKHIDFRNRTIAFINLAYPSLSIKERYELLKTFRLDGCISYSTFEDLCSFPVENEVKLMVKDLKSSK